MAKLEMREKNLEERGQKRLTTLVQSMAERSKETETALKNARERHARHWEERKERILREHEGEHTMMGPASSQSELTTEAA